MAKYKFAAFSATSVASTCTAWKQDVDMGLAFPSDVEQVLQWTKTHLAHVDGDSAAYGVFPEGSEEAIGICEVVINKGGPKRTWVKLLRLRLRPNLDEQLYNNDTGALGEAISVFAASVLGVLKLKSTHKTPTLKVYGRTKEQLNFLQQTALALRSLNSTHEISIEGRFLVISNKGK